MNPIDLDTLSRADLDIFVENYSKAGIAIPAGLTTKPKIVAFIKDQVATIGTTKVLTQADIDADPQLGEEGHAEGDVVIVPPTGGTQVPPVDQTPADAPHTPVVTSVKVSYINPEIGLTEREFSKDVHGEKFQDVAALFAEKFNGTVI